VLAGFGAPSDVTDDATIDMKPQPEPSTQEVLAGLVERVTYHNAENGFCVLRTKARGHRDLVGIGPVRAVSVLAAWAEQKAVRGSATGLRNNSDAALL
jgi:hypothetical protein